jgi:2-polyprenyl-3-methyl-5-hydroxy-6-metoxy-1,4-benzoquinol methylase
VEERDPGNCPVCGFEKYVIPDGPRSTSRYVRCLECSHAWLFPLPTQTELVAYYNTTYQVPEDGHFASAEREFPAIESLARPKSKPGARMLEIGCSYGGMLAKFAAHGWKVEGIELDARAVKVARDRLRVMVHEGDLETTRSLLTPPYDVVAAYHVVEHIIQPEEFLERMRDLCTSDGLVVLRLPNGSSVGARATEGWWEWALIPEHVHLFSARSISLLLAKAGFEIESMISRRGDANTLLFNLANAIGKKAWHARRLSKATGTSPARPAVRPSETAFYRKARSVLNFLGRPIDAVLGATTFFGKYPLPELLVAARVGNRSHPVSAK